jgi:transposase
VIAGPPGVRILLAARPVDFRKGMDGLAALVQQALRADPFAGDLFIFRAKRADGSRSWSTTAPAWSFTASGLRPGGSAGPRQRKELCA